VRRPVGLLVLGLAALLVQGTLATFAPVFALPDLVFLTVVGVAIAAGGAEGLLVSAALGYAMDLLTGALLGQHALLLVTAYAVTRVANLRLNLMRPVPRVAFIAALTLAYDLGHAGLARLMSGAADIDWNFARNLLVHAAVNAACAPMGVALVQRAAALLAGEEEGARMRLHVEPRRREV
jgi:rod shape-determining protein MreD